MSTVDLGERRAGRRGWSGAWMFLSAIVCAGVWASVPARAQSDAKQRPAGDAPKQSVAPGGSGQPGGGSGGGGGGGPPRMGPPPANVVFDTVSVETIEQWRAVTGSLRAVRRAALASQEEGIVIELVGREGEAVERGAVLARLDDERAQLEVQRAQAEVRSKAGTLKERQAQAGKYRRDVERLEQLTARGSASPQELEDARTSLAEAEARAAQAAADLAVAESREALARRQLADMTIRAPFAGQIVRRRTEVGQWVQAGDAIVDIADLSTVEAWLDVPERYIGRLTAIKSGESPSVRIVAPALDLSILVPLSAGRVVPEADAMSRLFPVWVRLENADGRLKPGLTITGLVPTGVAEATVMVHKDAVLRDAAGEFVYVNAGGVAMPARITTMFAVGGRFAVRPQMTEGPLALRTGTQVVVEGNERLFPGQPLMGRSRAETAPAANAGEQR